MTWKEWKNWLEKEAVDSSNLLVRIKDNKQGRYKGISLSSLNRFWESLEATLDKDDSKCYLFPNYEKSKSFEEVFGLTSSFQLGKKTETEEIDLNSYRVLHLMWDDWKRNSQVNERKDDFFAKYQGHFYGGVIIVAVVMGLLIIVKKLLISY